MAQRLARVRSVTGTARTTNPRPCLRGVPRLVCQDRMYGGGALSPPSRRVACSNRHQTAPQSAAAAAGQRLSHSLMLNPPRSEPSDSRRRLRPKGQGTYPSAKLTGPKPGCQGQPGKKTAITATVVSHAACQYAVDRAARALQVISYGVQRSQGLPPDRPDPFSQRSGARTQSGPGPRKLANREHPVKPACQSLLILLQTTGRRTAGAARHVV